MDVLLCLAWALYLLPFMVAVRKDHPRIPWILALNFLLGWTVVGWIGSLWWALHPPAARAEPEPLRRRGHLRLLPGSLPDPQRPVRRTPVRRRAASGARPQRPPLR
jgi:hypothetical protein